MSQLIIEAGRTERQYWRDLWRYRELFYVLAWRDISVRYKQTTIGVLWAILQPLLTTIVLTVTFSRIAHLPSLSGAPYFLMVFTGNVAWQFFSTSLSGASQSVITNANLISKIYFPRMIIPTGAMVTAMADLGISLLMLPLMMAWFGFWPSWHIVFLPAFMLMAFAAALGPGLILTALSVRYRDFRFVIPFILQFGIFISPVGFETAVLPDYWRPLYSLNPMVGVIDGFRWAILGGRSELDPPGFLLSLLMTGLFMILGVSYFRRTERVFADII